MDEDKPKKPDSVQPASGAGPDPEPEEGAEPKPEAKAAKPKAAPAGKSAGGDQTGAGDGEKPDAPAKPAKPAKAQPKSEGPAKPPPRKPPQRGPAYEDLEDDPLLQALQAEFGEATVSGQTFLGQSIYTAAPEILYDAMLFLRDRPEGGFDYLVDLTALDLLPEEPRFCLVYHLYAYPEGPLIRVKSRLAVGEYAPSVTSIWAVADWMEREVFDMFGIEFSGHPDLRRILLPEDWHGFPLRKDYDIKLQDQAWIRKHLRIRKVPD